MKRLKKFYVHFYCETDEDRVKFNSLIDEDDFDEDIWDEVHSFKNSIEINCSLDDYINKFSQNSFITSLKDIYELIDEKRGNKVGFYSYDIKLENASEVWNKLINELGKLGFIK